MEITPCHLMIIVAVKVGDAANNEVNATVYEAVATSNTVVVHT
jgi:hypothetical protein